MVRRQAVILGFAAAILLVSAWFFADDRGVVAIAAGMGFGWMVRFLTPARVVSAVTPARLVPAVTPAPVGESVARLQVLEARTASLRHDLRGILSPALLTAERLLGHEDAGIRRAGEMMVKTVERASARLAETKLPVAPPAEL